MFSFRRKPKKEPDSPRIRTSPSLPELNSQGIPWPEDLVDLNAIRQEEPEQLLPTQEVPAPVPFHKPFRPSQGRRHEGPISSLYMPSPCSTPDPKAGPRPSGRYSQRRARAPPTFNIMVVGGKGTGKSSLLRLLLETADTSPGASVDQRAAVERFLKGPPKATQEIQTACVEICESRFDRVLFSVIDTPGLDFQEGRELKLERQVNAILKYVDMQYADTMSEESKVVRKSKGDQHIHLCIYMIDPGSIMTADTRRALSVLPTKTRSETTISKSSPPDLVPDTSSGDDTDDEEDDGRLTMSPAEIRVIRRLCSRVNVLPVISRADSLTDEKLLGVKDSIRTGLAEAGIDFGVFGPTIKTEETPKRVSRVSIANGDSSSSAGHDSTMSEVPEEAESDGEGEDDERQTRTVIKLRTTRRGRHPSRSRSRRDLSDAASADLRRPISPDANDSDSVANVRFSAHIVAKTDLVASMPFALIAPEPDKRRQRPEFGGEAGLGAAGQPGRSMGSESEVVPDTPPPSSSSNAPRSYPFLNGRPEDLKGVFIRKFRWGTVDVLNPSHCDFSALRTAVFSTHLNLLKIRTKEVLYEKYRTEKLLARRATANISDDQRQRLLEDLGL